MTLVQLFFFFLLSACSGGQSGGFAPGQSPSELQPIQNSKAYSVDLSLGHQITTSNGWKIEARYE